MSRLRARRPSSNGRGRLGGTLASGGVGSVVPAARPPVADLASRSTTRSWRNPRMLIGIVLVALSVVLGAKLMDAADDTVGVWTAARDLPAGVRLSEDDVVRRQVRFTDQQTAQRYLAADDRLPSVPLAQAIGSGELLPRAATRPAAADSRVEVPLSAATDDVPSTVGEGSVVDVWVSPKTPPEGESSIVAVKVLTEVTVVALPPLSRSLGPQASRQVIVGVPLSTSPALAGALGAMVDGRIVLTKVR